MNTQPDFSNIQFRTAASFILFTQEHIFLTGKAGTGKTTFLKHIKEQCNKNFILTAPTGVAAINAGGVTLHSFFQLPLGTYIADYRKNWGIEEEQHIVNRQQLLSKIRMNASKRKLIKEMQLLIIDEISMVRADTLDAVDTVLRHIRNKDMAFGGVQLLLIGDLYQLPPVVRQHELMLMQEYYRSPFFFDAQALREQQPICIELDKIYRQDDEQFIKILNNIRNNEVEQEDLEVLHKRYMPDYAISGSEGIITLTSHNAQADSINQSEIARLSSREHILKAKVSGDFPEHAFPMESELILKEGAQIMFIKNDKGEFRKYYNGKIGKVNRINKADNEIEIYFPKEKNFITIEPEAWENIRYKLNEEKNEIEEEVAGRFEQFPVRLAWAVTIHKSQGLTFDEAIIDAGRSFAPGQVYVALSRMTSLQGTILRSQIARHSITVDNRIVEYMSAIKGSGNWQERLAAGEKMFLHDEITGAFRWHLTAQRIREYMDTSIGILTQEFIQNHEQYRNCLLALADLDKVGKHFGPQLSQLYFQEAYPALKERVHAASRWFLDNLYARVLDPLAAWQEQLSVQKNGAKASEAVKYMLRQCELQAVKIRRLSDTAGLLAEGADYDTVLHYWTNKIPGREKEENNKSKTSAKQPSRNISLELFKKGNSPEDIAQKRNMAVSTVISHLAACVQDGSLKASELIPDNKLLEIMDIMQQYPADTLTELKNRTKDAFTYDELKIARAYMERSKQE